MSKEYNSALQEQLLSHITISRDHFNNEEDIPCLTLLTSLRLFLCFWQR